MNAIVDYQTYTNEMLKGIEDKLFFMDKIKFSTLLDYGCADGALIEIMKDFYPHKKYVGYDFNPNMIRRANAKKIENAHFFDKIEEANIEMEKEHGKKAVLSSSLIHEVYSYCTEEQINVFWQNIFSGNYDYVIIRDMALSKSNVNKYKFAKKEDIYLVKKYANHQQLEQFEKIWGSITYQCNLVHFLMKYRYINNWSREVEENYFPIYFEDYLDKIPDNYEIELLEHYTLPFHKDIIYKDFGINFEEKTHLKFILKKV